MYGFFHSPVMLSLGADKLVSVSLRSAEVARERIALLYLALTSMQTATEFNLFNGLPR